MSGWRGSGGRGCRRLLQEIWQKMSGEKGSGIRKGSRLKQRFSAQETSQRRICIKGRGVGWHQNSSSTDPVPQAKGTRGSRILTDTPEKRTQSLGAELRKGETEAISRGEGGRACKAVQYRKRAKPLPMPQGIGLRPREGDVGDVHLGGERRGARPGIGKGPGGGSHADKHRDKLISSVYPGAGASSPATLLPFSSLARE